MDFDDLYKGPTVDLARMAPPTVPTVGPPRTGVKSAATKRNRLVHGKSILHLEMGTPPNPKPLTAKSAKWVRVYEPVDREERLALATGRNQKLSAAYQFWPERIGREAANAQALARDLQDSAKQARLKPPRIPLAIEW